VSVRRTSFFIVQGGNPGLSSGTISDALGHAGWPVAIWARSRRVWDWGKRSRICCSTSRSAWQNGYGAFSVSESRSREVWRYIQNQEEHHHQVSYETELRSLLARHRVVFGPAGLLG
jgi:hypothetical protein